MLGGGDWAKDNAIYEAWMMSEDKKRVLIIQATRTDSQRGGIRAPRGRVPPPLLLGRG